MAMNEELERLIAEAKEKLGGAPTAGEVAPLLPKDMQGPFWDRMVNKYFAEQLEEN